MIKKNKSHSLYRIPTHTRLSFEHKKSNKIYQSPFNNSSQIKPDQIISKQSHRPVYFGIFDFLVPLVHPAKKQIEIKVSETSNNINTLNEKISFLNRSLTDELISHENRQDLIIFQKNDANINVVGKGNITINRKIQQNQNVSQVLQVSSSKVKNAIKNVTSKITNDISNKIGNMKVIDFANFENKSNKDSIISSIVDSKHSSGQSNVDSTINSVNNFSNVKILDAIQSNINEKLYKDTNLNNLLTNLNQYITENYTIRGDNNVVLNTNSSQEVQDIQQVVTDYNITFKYLEAIKSMNDFFVSDKTLNLFSNKFKQENRHENTSEEITPIIDIGANFVNKAIDTAISPFNNMIYVGGVLAVGLLCLVSFVLLKSFSFNEENYDETSDPEIDSVSETDKITRSSLLTNNNLNNNSNDNSFRENYETHDDSISQNSYRVL